MYRKRDVYYWQERSILKNLNMEWKEHVVFKIKDKEGIEGLGASTPDEKYGETFKTTMAVVEKLRYITENFDNLNNINKLEKHLNEILKREKASKTAVMLAVYDYFKNKNNIDLSEVIFENNQTNNYYLEKIYVSTNQLNYIETNSENLKLELINKISFKEIFQLLENYSSKNIWLDLRGYYNIFELRQIINNINKSNIIALEQPLNEYYDDIVKKITSIPIYWDESIQRIEDIRKIQNSSTGLVLDLSKFGGLITLFESLILCEQKGLETVLSSRIEHPENLKWSKKIQKSFNFIDLNYDYYVDQVTK